MSNILIFANKYIIYAYYIKLWHLLIVKYTNHPSFVSRLAILGRRDFLHLINTKNGSIQTQADFITFERQKMAIAVKGGLDRGVAKLGLNKLGVRILRD